MKLLLNTLFAMSVLFSLQTQAYVSNETDDFDGFSCKGNQLSVEAKATAPLAVDGEGIDLGGQKFSLGGHIVSVVIDTRDKSISLLIALNSTVTRARYLTIKSISGAATATLHASLSTPMGALGTAQCSMYFK